MIVTLSIRCKIHPPLTRDRALRLASLYLVRRPVIVAGGNRKYLVNPTKEERWIPGDGRGLMKAEVSTQVVISAREKLIVDRVERLARDVFPLESIVRVVGGKYVFLTIVEDGCRHTYRLATCELCGRDTLEGAPYCERCLSVAMRDDRYYSVDACVALVKEMAEKGCDVESYWKGWF